MLRKEAFCGTSYWFISLPLTFTAIDYFPADPECILMNSFLRLVYIFCISGFCLKTYGLKYCTETFIILQVFVFHCENWPVVKYKMCLRRCVDMFCSCVQLCLLRQEDKRLIIICLRISLA